MYLVTESWKICIFQKFDPLVLMEVLWELNLGRLMVSLQSLELLVSTRYEK